VHGREVSISESGPDALRDEGLSSTTATEQIIVEMIAWTCMDSDHTEDWRDDDV
jgi:hypothetical protein